METAEHGEMGLRTEHPMDGNVIGKIEGIDGVEQVIPVESLPVSFETHDDDGNVRVGSLSKERAELLRDIVQEGSLSYEDMVKDDSVITTDGGVWEEVYGWELEVGDTVKFTWYDGQQEREKSYAVCGIIYLKQNLCLRCFSRL